MAEYLTLYDRQGRDTGFVQLRDGSVRAGACYLVVSIFTTDRAGRFLVTRRSPQKAFFPLCWEVTGGCVQAGEESEEGARRELAEETGLVPTRLRYLGRRLEPTLTGNAYFWVDVYRAWVEGDAPSVTMQREEVCEARWVEAQELAAMVKSLPMEPLTPVAWYAFEKELAPFAGERAKGEKDEQGMCACGPGPGGM